MRNLKNMSKLALLVAVLSMAFGMKANAQKQALVIAYSQTENVYEDDNLKAELVRLGLRITNKTNKTIFVDRRSSFYYFNDDEPICLYEEKKSSGNYSNIQTLAPNSQTWIANLKDQVARKYDAGGSYSRYGYGSAQYFSDDAKVQFMGYIETMRFELANNPNQSCAKLHLTGDESFIKVKASITYSMDQNFLNNQNKDAELKSFSVQTWVSDMIMSKYFVQGQDKVVRSRAVNVQGRMTNILHVFADSPFEYDEDLSPLDMYFVSFGKGSFTVTKYNNVSDGDGSGSGLGGALTGKNKKDSEEMESNFEKRSSAREIFVWEGETTNWVQAMTTSYAKCLEDDGEKPKKALDKAKKFAKTAKSQQTLKP